MGGVREAAVGEMPDDLDARAASTWGRKAGREGRRRNSTQNTMKAAQDSSRKRNVGRHVTNVWVVLSHGRRGQNSLCSFLLTFNETSFGNGE